MAQTTETLILLIIAIPVYFLAHILTNYLETGRFWKPSRQKPVKERKYMEFMVPHQMLDLTEKWDKRWKKRIKLAECVALNTNFECKVMVGRSLRPEI